MILYGNSFSLQIIWYGFMWTFTWYQWRCCRKQVLWFQRRRDKRLNLQGENLRGKALHFPRICCCRRENVLNTESIHLSTLLMYHASHVTVIPNPSMAPSPLFRQERFELMRLGFKSHNGPSAASLKMSVKAEPVEADCDITPHMCSCVSVLCCACRSNV